MLVTLSVLLLVMHHGLLVGKRLNRLALLGLVLFIAAAPPVEFDEAGDEGEGGDDHERVGLVRGSL